MKKRRTSPAAFAVPAIACAVLGLTAPAARAQEERKIQLSGLLDTYYNYSFGNLRGGTAYVGRSFDPRANAFSLSMAELNAKLAPTKENPYGFTATLIIGDAADIIHATEPGGVEKYKNILQAYGTYVFGGDSPITLDFGKFVTYAGYEVIEASGNDNYTRGLLFNYAIPFYHAGLRVSKPLTPSLTGTLFLVNGWNNVEEDNSGKSVGAQLAWVTPRLSAWLNYLGGNERTGAGLTTDLNVQLFDVIAVFQATPKLKLAANLDYASAGGGAGGNWSGQAVYARYQLSEKNAAGIRFEHFEDSDGLRTGTAQNLNEVTLTFEHAPHTNVLFRIEFRHDHAGTNFYPSKAGGSKNQDTLTFGGIFKF